MSKVGAFATGLCVGAIGGGVAALLLTPRNGEENRALVSEYATNACDQAQSFGEQSLATLQGKFQEGCCFSENFVGNVKSAAENAGVNFGDKNDELRAKIEAARDRIAQQVKKNAEQCACCDAAEEVKEAAEEVAEAVEEAAEDAKEAATEE